MEIIYIILAIALVVALTELIKSIKNNRPGPKVAVIFCNQN